MATPGNGFMNTELGICDWVYLYCLGDRSFGDFMSYKAGYETISFFFLEKKKKQSN